MKASNYNTTTDPSDAYVMNIHHPLSGTKSVTIKSLKENTFKSQPQFNTLDDYYNWLDEQVIPVEKRRTIYRGKNLGTAMTNSQSNGLTTGTYKGFFIGDYWLRNGYYAYIADIDYYRGVGTSNPNSPVQTNTHLVILMHSNAPRKLFTDETQMEGGYMNSNVYKFDQNQAMPTSIFGGNWIKNHPECITIDSVGGQESPSYQEVSIKYSIPSIQQIIGINQLAVQGARDIWGFDSQLALFKLQPTSFIARKTNGYGMWTRNIYNKTQYIYVQSNGYIGNANPVTTDALCAYIFCVGV